MSRNQKIVVGLATLLACLAGLFPPWNFVAIPAPGYKTVRSAGYAWIFDPATPVGVSGGLYSGEIEPKTGNDIRGVSAITDTERLLPEWALIVIVAGGTLLILKKKCCQAKKVRLHEALTT